MPNPTRKIDPTEIAGRYLPLVQKMARTLAARLPITVDVKDLMAAGVCGLMDAISRYNDKRDVKFSTFARFRIRGQMLDMLRDLDWCSRDMRRRTKLIGTVS